MKKSEICIIDDNLEYLEAISKPLIEDFVIHKFSRAKDFLKEFERGLSASAFLVDYKIPDMNGIELCLAIRKRDPSVPIIVISGWLDKKIALDAFSVGATDLLEKPFSLDDLKHSLERALRRDYLQKYQTEKIEKLLQLSQELEKLVKSYEARYTFAENQLLELVPSAFSERKIAAQYLKNVSQENEIHRYVEAIQEEIKTLEENEKRLEMHDMGHLFGIRWSKRRTVSAPIKSAN